MCLKNKKSFSNYSKRCPSPCSCFLLNSTLHEFLFFINPPACHVAWRVAPSCDWWLSSILQSASTKGDCMKKKKSTTTFICLNQTCPGSQEGCHHRDPAKNHRVVQQKKMSQVKLLQQSRRTSCIKVLLYMYYIFTVFVAILIFSDYI